MSQMKTTTSIVRFLHSEEGSATPLALFFVLITLVMGGLSVDYNKAVSEQTQLQAVADVAAHTAIYEREFKTVEASRAAALARIDDMLPDVAFQNAIAPSDIEFGYWDETTSQFVLDNSRRDAVRVTGRMRNDRGNASRNILLSLVGRDTFDIFARATYTTYFPPCFNEGFVAEGVVDVQSGNNYTDGFCIHSNTYVSINQNNYFEPGTVVSMPSLNDLDIPSSGFEQNVGLQTALREGEYRMRLLRQLPDIIQSYYDGTPNLEHVEIAGIVVPAPPIYPLLKGNGTKAAFEPSNASDTGKKTLEPESFPTPHAIYRSDCAGNGDITFSADTFSDFVLVTNCSINFSNGTVLDGVIIATTHSGADSVNASHVQIGLDDNCNPDGNAAIYTYGSVSTAAALQGYGAQIVALGDIQFAANANGIEGVSFIAGGQIDGTSNMNMGFCEGEGVENFVRVPYFRLIE